MSFNTLSDAKAFAFAGNALITLESRKTWNHFTYKVKLAKDKKDFFFVSRLAHGSADEGDFAYLGIVAGGTFRLTKKSAAKADDPCVKAFEYFMRQKGPEMPSLLVVHHSNRCGKCGRTLTEPTSIESGIGPECAKRIPKVKAYEHHELHSDLFSEEEPE